MEITKASGEKEEFSREKFCKSLEEAGVAKDDVREVCETIAERIEPGITTSKIFRETLRILVKRNPKAATRYNMRQGIADLGPAGFLFEHYVEIVLRTLGYKTERNVMRKGECVEHEIDVVARTDGELYLVEAKYHNKRSIKTHIDTVMYADARRGDIERAKEGDIKMWLFTNTKFTSKAVAYAECRNLSMTGWHYPNGKGLEDIAEQFALYPVTSLPSVDRKAREAFAAHNMMLAQDLAPYNADKLHHEFAIPKPRAQKIAREVQALLYKDKM